LLQCLLVASSSSFSSISLSFHSSVDIIRGAASSDLRIPKVLSFGGCAAVVEIFNGVEDWPGRIRARQKKVGNKLRRGKLVAVVADDDGAADSNGASSGRGEDVAPTAPDCESIVSLLCVCVCISVCVCVPFLSYRP
jgi:hypothetical protein